MNNLILKERICLFENYSSKELEKLCDFLSPKMAEFFPKFKILLDFDREKKVEEALSECEEFDKEMQIEKNDGYKMCVICGYDRKTLFYIVKAIKYVINEKDKLIFAEANESCIKMKVKKIFEENIMDHEYIKKYGIRPEN